MKRPGWWVTGAVLACVWSCDDEPTEPLAGAGIRIILPEGAGSLEGLRVSLRDRPEGYYLPGCSESTQSSVYEPKDFLDLPDCGEWSVEISDLLHTPVRHITVSGNFGAVWDGLDDDGHPVPSGFYFVTRNCVDVDSLNWVNGLMVLRNEDADSDSCTWQLWAQDVTYTPFRGVLYAPFPIRFHLGRQTDPSEEELSASFENPFLIQAEASGMQPYKQEITLVEGQYTDVRVTFTPLETP